MIHINIITFLLIYQQLKYSTQTMVQINLILVNLRTCSTSCYLINC